MKYLFIGLILVGASFVLAQVPPTTIVPSLGDTIWNMQVEWSKKHPGQTATDKDMKNIVEAAKAKADKKKGDN